MNKRNKKFLMAAIFALTVTLTVNTAFSAPVAGTKSNVAVKTLPAKVPNEMVKKPDAKCPDAEGRKFKGGEEDKGFENKLNLTDAQKAKAKEVRLQGREKMEPIMKEMKANREKMEALKNSDTPDKEAKMKALKEEMKPLWEKANTLRKENMAEFEKILTPEQKTKFEEMKKEMKAQHPHGPGKGGEFGKKGEGKPGGCPMPKPDGKPPIKK